MVVGEENEEEEVECLSPCSDEPINTGEAEIVAHKGFVAGV